MMPASLCCLSRPRRPTTRDARCARNPENAQRLRFLYPAHMKVCFGDRTIPSTRTHPRDAVERSEPERDGRVLTGGETVQSKYGTVCKVDADQIPLSENPHIEPAFPTGMGWEVLSLLWRHLAVMSRRTASGPVYCSVCADACSSMCPTASNLYVNESSRWHSGTRASPYMLIRAGVAAQAWNQPRVSRS